jgi:hypothetical protein
MINPGIIDGLFRKKSKLPDKPKVHGIPTLQSSLPRRLRLRTP